MKYRSCGNPSYAWMHSHVDAVVIIEVGRKSMCWILHWARKYDIRWWRVFGLSFSAFQRLLIICCNYLAEHEIVFSCKNTVDVDFNPEKLSNLFSGRKHQILTELRKFPVYWTSQISRVCYFMPHWKVTMTFWGSEITSLCSKQTQRHLCSVLSCSQPCFVPIA